MRRILGTILLLAGLLAVLPAAAQETYTLSVNAAQVTQLRDIITAENERTCQNRSQPFTCTQAQACTGTGVVCTGGAACTAPQARACGARIYPDTIAGREEYVTFGIAAPEFVSRRQLLPTWWSDRQCRIWATADAPTRQSMCTGSQLPTNCTLCGS